MQVVMVDSKFWHRLALGAASATLALALTPVLSAQSSGQGSAQTPTQQKTTQAADKDINRTELRNFDAFLDKHPEIREDLSKNPSLVNNEEYVENHPQLAEFLKNHPGVREELKENPKAFMNREGGFEKHEGGERPGDINRTELRNFDGFLDTHPEIREDLSKNPSLVNNEEYVENHPQLAEFLKNHPGVREELKENPKAFMGRERGFEKQEGGERAGDINRTELNNFDAFLDKHPEIRKELTKNPSLADNKEYLENHPELAEFLKNHPGVREELKENPKAFMARERGLEKGEHAQKEKPHHRPER